ncbi:MAG: SpoIID/LytB domain-containing protein [Defluviitaleaceae bacterium]|nr:SpoIID/LytB domain-containing protein [Defluviitaleaceae bacterium]
MIKKLRILALAIFMIIIMHTTVYANIDGYIRVGVGSSASSISIEAASLDVFFILDGDFENMGNIVGSGVFTISADSSYYIFIEDTNSGYLAALNSASGRNASPVLLERGTWGVYAGPFGSRAEAQNHAFANGGALVEPNGRRLALNSGGQVLAVFENYRLTPFFADGRGGKININGSYYRGYLDAHRSGSNITPVNVVNIEEYLFSVVPSEMPASWHMEALKAQAVAARSYAYTTLGAHANQGFDLCNTEHCQVYWGMSRETEATTAAVLYTRGILAFFDGEIINAVYSSSSGGITDDSENVWIAASPYLRGRSDIYDTTGREWTRTLTLTELTAIARANNYNIGNVTSMQITEISSTGRVLRVTLTGENGTINLERERIRTFFGPSAGGNLYSRNFRIGSFALTVDGTVINTTLNNTSLIFTMSNTDTSQIEVGHLMVLGADGEIVPIIGRAANVQTAVGVQTLRASGGSALPPTHINNVQVTGGVASNGYVITLIGRGWGHGVGMSQHGARGMAEAGYTFDEILKHYYTGITLSPRRED